MIKSLKKQQWQSRRVWFRERMSQHNFQQSALLVLIKKKLHKKHDTFSRFDLTTQKKQRMPKGLGTWEVRTSFPLGPSGDPYPTNKQKKAARETIGTQWNIQVVSPLFT